ncbi:hypothetical protein LOTGIDRAFT_229359 [Lottia gigantea]|uniref:SEC7 domain-containing protein n=1 Tax=Lottia gigantea TaxID=225164 RepID=V3Z8K5_LOTGI|nr:hypothetical protein LOTGIDRAFT_229359 [Lottia gigantea]ESO87248.1 hypothetical protein LOTGIDRAFT_229359 [Lottia gigantea]
MEETLTKLQKDCSGQRLLPIKKSCIAAIETLKSPEKLSSMPTCDVREICLEPIQLALESRSKRLMSHAIVGLQELLKDERFQCNFEAVEEKLLPVQVLNSLYITPNLPEEAQVEIMKFLLNMTFSISWCMNAKVICKVSQLYIDIHLGDLNGDVGSLAYNNYIKCLDVLPERLAIIENLPACDQCEVFVDTYSSSSLNVRGSVKAAMTQMLKSYTEKLRELENKVVEDGDNVLADFKQSGNNYMSSEGLMDDIVAILRFFSGKLNGTQSSGGQGKQEVQILVEGILSLLTNSPLSIRNHAGFQELVWRNLCPDLISLLGTPKAERSILMTRSLSMEEGVVGRGSARSTSAPNVNVATAKIIYAIANQLVRLIGTIGTLRPVLESLFHRMLIYPPPQHRLDALKSICEILSSPELVADISAPPSQEEADQKVKTLNDVPLLRLIVDSLQESSQCTDIAVCFVSVQCADQLLGTLDKLCNGEGLIESVVEEINNTYIELGKDISNEYNGRKESLVEDGGSVSKHSDDDDEEEEEAEIDDKKETSGSESETINKEKESPKKRLGSIGKQTVEDEMDLKITIQNQVQSDQRQEMVRRHRLLRDKFEAVERQNAKLFIHQFKRILPQLFNMYSIQEVDQGLKQFASNFCAGMVPVESYCEDVKDLISSVILNADGIYTASLLSLLLSLKLNLNDYYNGNKTAKQPLTETAGYNKHNDTALIQMLKEIDGLESHEIGGQLLSDGKENSGFIDIGQEKTGTQAVEAGKKLSKLILYVCYDDILDVLSVLLTGKSSCGSSSSLALLLGTEGAKEESMRARNAICLSLDGLRKAAKLCCMLGLQNRCAGVFTQLATTSCVKEDFKSDNKQNKSSVLPSKPKLARLHAAHVLSMDAVMTTGLEMGSHSADCWQHVFRCCAHISELEHTYFSGGNNQSSLPKIQQEQTAEIDMAPPNENELYAAPVVPVGPIAPHINVLELIRQSSIESGWDSSLTGGGVLTHAQATKALCGLSQEVDSLFEDAARKLNLMSLLSFLTELGEASRAQLRKLGTGDYETGRLPTNALHLYRLQDVLMKVVNSTRPLLHLIRAWSVISPYLVEATGHHERSISKMAVTCIHEFIVAMLSNHEELPHFHVNEFLCKTFEDMLCLELCDGDVQDQIVCSLCEEVEACTAQIQSGWRPVFGALRSVKIEYTANEEVNEARQRHIAAVLDVFEVYLSTDNILVYANATVDCILCLLKYVHGPGMFEYGSDDDSESGSDLGAGNQVINDENLCIPALKYLKRCCDILTHMWKMPACPPFKGSQRIQLGNTVKVVDPNIPDMNFESFAKHFNADQPDVEISPDKDPDWVVVQPDAKSSQSVDSGMVNGSQSEHSLQPSDVKQDVIGPGKVEWKPKPLDDLDNPSGILHVWYLLLDGLATSISSCPKTFQPQTLQTLFELLRSAADVPGPEFAVHCVNHLVLPMLQSWLRRGSRIQNYWISGAVNFKQCLGNTADLVVDYLNKFVGDKETHAMLEFMIKQMLDVLTECVAQPVERISRLGCSCIRHVLSSAGPLLTESMWQICAESIQRALNITTYSVRQLMTLFHANSENFYGDIGQVKVATRKDCTPIEFIRLKQLAHQVFLLESQVSIISSVKFDMDEDKSFIFLLYPPNHEDSLNPEHIMTRVPFRNIVVGLLSHQLLLQTIGYLLLDGAEIKSDSSTDTEFIPKQSHTKIPGLLPYMSTRNVLTFLECLQSAYSLACDFDSRPGLKFLVQKVAGLDVAANLYKQAGASIVYYVHSLVEICCHNNSISLKNTQEILETSNVCERDTGIISDLVLEKRHSSGGILTSPDVFTYLLQNVCDELCQTYVDVLVDKEGTARFDRMEEQPLFFLIAQPDDMSDVTSKKVRRSSSTRSNKSDSGGVVSSPVIIDTQDSKWSFSFHLCPSKVVRPYKGCDIVSVQATFQNTPEETTTKNESDEEEVMNGDQGQEGKGQGLIDEGQGKSKREIREDKESRVYTVATDKTIKSLMSKYKQRKQQNSMPSFVKLVNRMKDVRKDKVPRKEVVDEKIEKQQQSSIMKDSEAHLRSWSEMLTRILQLFLQMDDLRFKSLIPVIYNCNTQLVCHSDDPRLKQTLATWFHRLGNLYHYSPIKRLVKPDDDVAVAQSDSGIDTNIDQSQMVSESQSDQSQIASKSEDQ